MLDVGNGLGVQDAVIAEVSRARELVAFNVTESQLHAGRHHLDDAGALPVVGDATRLPLADASVDGVISVEAAFHFPSRAAFFAEVARVLRPGGVLAMSDVPVERRPRTPGEFAAGLLNARSWSVPLAALASTERIESEAAAAGLVDIDISALVEVETGQADGVPSAAASRGPAWIERGPPSRDRRNPVARSPRVEVDETHQVTFKRS